MIQTRAMYESASDKMLAGICGIIGGMMQYIHLDVLMISGWIDKIIQPAITAAICGFAGVAGKHLYEYVTKLFKKKKTKP